MAEIDKAGNVGGESVCKNDEIGREGIPDDKGGNENPLDPMGEFSAPGFENEFSQVIGFG